MTGKPFYKQLQHGLNPLNACSGFYRYFPKTVAKRFLLTRLRVYRSPPHLYRNIFQDTKGVIMEIIYWFLSLPSVAGSIFNKRCRGTGQVFRRARPAFAVARESITKQEKSGGNICGQC